MTEESLKARLLRCKVMHKRTQPAENQFTYRMWYLWTPVSDVNSLRRWFFSIDRWNMMSFHHADHGYRDGRSCQQWLEDQLARFELNELMPERFSGEWMLLTMPRLFGYVFNPVSFWCALDAQHRLHAVIAEVNNTFGETHSYLLRLPDGTPIEKEQWIHADKQFHVSPFLKVEGEYRFRFDLSAGGAAIWIDYYNQTKERELLTAVIGRFQPYKSVTLLKVFLQIPFVTFKAILLIHYQALQLWLKKVRYHCKPEHPGRYISKWPNQSE